MVEEYWHTETREERLQKGDLFSEMMGTGTTIHEKNFTYKGREFLALQCSDGKEEPYTIVPGYFIVFESLYSSAKTEPNMRISSSS